MNLDKYQKEAVVTDEKTSLVIASPGSGKTTVIINRAADLIHRKRVNPDNIIVITFTKAAADNMRLRYKKSFPGKAPFFGTFHALCYRIIGRFIGEIKIIDSSMSYRIVKKTLETYMDDIGEDKIKEVLNNISLFKCSFKEVEDFKPSLDKEIFIKCYNAYEDYKRSEDLIDFDDMQIMVKEYMDKNPILLSQYRRLFRHILVDEFQDCDDIQIYLLKLFSNNGENSIFAVGDEDQCIYSFRGSKPQYMVNFEKEFNGGHKFYLSYNYRSTQNIVELSKRIISHNNMRNNKKIIGFRKDLGTIRHMVPLNEGMESEYIIDTIIGQYDKGTNYSDNAVLYRTNLESRSIIDACIRRKIPFFLLDKEYNFFNHFICQDIIAYLKLSINPYDRESFARVINKPFRYVKRMAVERVRKYEYNHECFEILKSVKDMAPFQIRIFEKLSKEINGLNKMSLSSAVSYILTDLEYMDYLKEYSAKFKVSFDDLNDIVEEFKSSIDGYSTISMFLAHVDTVREEMKNNLRNSKKDGVILSTIHGVKGMEFKNVYIINCVEDYIPHKRCTSSQELLEEERRLFYVAVTRAIDGLYIFSPKNMRGNSVKASEFINECSIEEHFDYGGYREGVEVFHKSFGKGVIKSLKDNTAVIDFNGMERTFNFAILLGSGLIEMCKN